MIILGIGIIVTLLALILLGIAISTTDSGFPPMHDDIVINEDAKKKGLFICRSNYILDSIKEMRVKYVRKLDI